MTNGYPSISANADDFLTFNELVSDFDSSLFHRIQSMDLEDVVFFTSDFPGGLRWNRVTARHVEKLYRQFLYITVTARSFRPVPTDMIDDFWHTHILMTEKYRSDCNNICDMYLEHDPLFGTRSETERAYYNRCKALTVSAFEATFGTTIEMLTR